jgi:NHLM bacteriocin system ABC transporter peptidase/ATP-binding protein
MKLGLGLKPKRVGERRVKTPTILQMEAVECGAASLGIVLAYYGRYVPLEELRVACGVSRDGSKASNLAKAARAYGLEVRAFKGEPAALPDLPVPQIVHWEFSHFLVVEGYAKDHIRLNDPASGPRKISWEDFSNSFTGIGLSLKPSPDFKRGGKPFSTLRALRQRLNGAQTALLFVILAGLSLVIPGLLVPTFTRIFVDDYLVRNARDWLVPLLVGMALTAVIRAGLTWLKEYYLLRLETRLSLGMSSKFFWHVLRLPVEYYYQRFAGEVGNRVAINDQVAYLLSAKLASTALDLVAIVFYAGLMWLYDPLLTGVAVFFALLNLVALRYVSRKRVDTNQRVLQERGKLTGTIMGGLLNIETLKAGGMESDFYARLSGEQASASQAEQQMSVYNQFLLVVPSLLMAVNTAGILALGGLRVVDGQLTVGMLVAFQTLMISFLDPINKLVELGTTLQDVQGGLKRLDDVFANPVKTGLDELEDPQQVSQRQPKLTGQLELCNITFGYNRLEPPLIENFQLSLRPGSRVALVGVSGSGKSTVAKLVSGLFQPWSGEILFDGKPASEIERVTLTNSLAVVDQDIFLFKGTIRDNLTLWDSTIPDAQMTQAAKDACIHTEIALRSGGYSAQVSEDGRNFSGGQRQRLEIARALATNPTLLILDEATSALDPITEQLIDRHLRRRGCTCLIIAHRLSTIRDCDEIIVMQHGKIVQRGTHQQLRGVAGSAYAELIAST